MSPGSSRMWTGYSRETMSSPGNSPPKRKNDRYVPTIGIDRIAPWAKRMPVPDSRSSGRE